MTDEVMKGRDIYECANQLGSYVGPETDEHLAQFLIRESKAAASLADEIVRLRNLATPAQTKGDDLEILGYLNWSEVHSRRYYDETPRGQREPWPLVRLSEAASCIQSLTAYNERERDEARDLANKRWASINTYQTALQAAQAEIARMREALEFYAEPTNYKGDLIPGHTDEGGSRYTLTHHVNKVRADAGTIARTALTPQEPT